MNDEGRQAVAKKLHQELYEEESWEVGSRLARAAKAREDGYPEVAALMRSRAMRPGISVLWSASFTPRRSSGMCRRTWGP